MLVRFDTETSDAPNKARQVKEWALRALGAGADLPILVTELRCTEPGCPPLETVIAVLGSEGRRELRIHAPLADIVEAQVVAALVPSP